jgi:hypothetical protein
MLLYRDSSILRNAYRQTPPVQWLASEFFYSHNPYADIARKLQEMVLNQLMN